MGNDLEPVEYRFPERAPIYAEVCERIAKGETLTSICNDLHMPAVRTIGEWTLRDATFARAYANARQLGFDAIADDVLRIADTPVIGVEEKVIPAVLDEEGNVKIPESVELKRGDMLGHRKLQVETRLKLLAKWDPKRYGEKSTVDLNAVVEQKLPLPQLQQEIQRLLRKGAVDVPAVEIIKPEGEST